MSDHSLTRRLPRFEIDQGEYGSRLVLAAGWSDHFVEYMLKEGIRELCVNYARGFQGESLYFLEQLPFLEALEMIVYNVSDLSPIQYLHNLRALNNGCRDKTPIDFSNFPRLENCGIDWRRGADSLFDCITLKRLWLNKYSDTTTIPFGKLLNIERLYIASSPITDLHGLSPLSQLKELGLYYLTKLESLSGTEALKSLEDLSIEACKKLVSIDPVHYLTNLKVLSIANCSDIESLHPIEGLVNLEGVFFPESTDIVDGDLSPLTRLPNLKAAGFQNRRHYSHKREQFRRPS